MTAAQLDSGSFRDVIGHFATGVTVITASEDGVDYGMTASAVTSLSLDPPMLLVCINRAVPTCEAISRVGRFAVNILSGDQGELALSFATPAPDKFAGVEIERGAWGEPLIGGALAHIECRVTEEVVGGTHSVFLSAAHDARSHPGTPLAYFRGGFGRLELGPDEATYAEVRERVLARRLPLGQPFDLDELAEQLGAERAAVFHAVARLRGEGLVLRESPGRYVVTPLDEQAVEAAFRARTTMERGAADVAVGALSSAELAELRVRMEATEPVGERVASEWFFDVNRAFHETLVRLGGGELLLRAHRQLAFEGILTRSLYGTELSVEVARADFEDHRRIVEAYESVNADGAKRVISAHAARAAQATKLALRGAGGQA